MSEEEHRRVSREARRALGNSPWPDFPVGSDQGRGIGMPPAQKSYGKDAELIALPRPDQWAVAKPNIADCIAERKSRRKFTEESLTMDELAYLLWSTQGVKGVTPSGRSYRTVPSAGGRHALETYLAINRVEGIKPGVYRYVPFEHRLLHLSSGDGMEERLGELASGQSFVGKSAVCFIWSAIPYRMEWRHGIRAPKFILLDVGHVCQNLYLACESIMCGACAIGLYDQEGMDRLLGLDGEDELVVYLAAVGRVRGERGLASAEAHISDLNKEAAV